MNRNVAPSSYLLTVPSGELCTLYELLQRGNLERTVAFLASHDVGESISLPCVDAVVAFQAWMIDNCGIDLTSRATTSMEWKSLVEALESPDLKVVFAITSTGLRILRQVETVRRADPTIQFALCSYGYTKEESRLAIEQIIALFVYVIDSLTNNPELCALCIEVNPFDN